MLQLLRIANYGLISEVEIQLGAGLTVLTGETGSGKSMVVDALALLAGGRAEGDCVREGASEASIEALFAHDERWSERLSAAGLPSGDGEVSIRRVIGRGGRSRAYVNGALVSASALQKLLQGIVELTGQNEHIRLLEAAAQRDMVDRFGELQESVLEHSRLYREWMAMDAELSAREAAAAEASAQKEFWEYQLDELERAALVAGEEEALEAERRSLAGVEKRTRLLVGAFGCLFDEGRALEQLSKADGLLNEAARGEPALEPLASVLRQCRLQLEDAQGDLGKWLNKPEEDPDGLRQVEVRLALLGDLCRKHRTTVAGLISKRDELSAQLEKVGGDAARSGELAAALGRARAALEASAKRLSLGRASAAKRMALEAQARLRKLSLPECRLACNVQGTGQLSAAGSDEVELLFSANSGDPLRPLAKVASGGELSRAMLALRSVLAQSESPGLCVLDEVDSGVSGAVAEVVGRLVREIARGKQVLCITHLPQVAAFADAHVRMVKQRRSGRTVSSAMPLVTAAERAQELARLLSGLQVTAEALSAARALLKQIRGSQGVKRLALQQVVA